MKLISSVASLIRRRATQQATLLAVGTLLAACGQKGPLTLPVAKAASAPAASAPVSK